MKSMRPGLIQLEIGVQSANPDTILEIRRKTDFEKSNATWRRSSRAKTSTSIWI